MSDQKRLHGILLDREESWGYIHNLINPLSMENYDIESFQIFLKDEKYSHNYHILSIKAYLYLMGVIYEKDELKALELMSQIDRETTNNSNNMLNWAYVHKYGLAHYVSDENKYLDYMKRAAELLHPKALFHLAEYYEKLGKINEANYYYWQAGLRYDFNSTCKIGDIYYEKGEIREAMKWYMKCYMTVYFPFYMENIIRIVKISVGKDRMITLMHADALENNKNVIKETICARIKN